ncbi:MAG TPA: hypothetical protein VF998_11940 [Candidatus Limnocylindria bacterium]
MRKRPATEPFDKPDQQVERVIEQQEGIVGDKGEPSDSDRPRPNVPHPEDVNELDR